MRELEGAPWRILADPLLEHIGADGADRTPHCARASWRRPASFQVRNALPSVDGVLKTAAWGSAVLPPRGSVTGRLTRPPARDWTNHSADRSSGIELDSPRRRLTSVLTHWPHCARHPQAA
jgi:hypothetical protein